MIPGNFLRDNSFMNPKATMKPQCETTQDCLRELARVMDQFGFKNIMLAIHSEYVRCSAWFDPKNLFISPSHWSFALAEVEGKAVFYKDTLYDWKGDAHLVPFIDGVLPMVFGKGCEWTWNPPKPKITSITVNGEKFELPKPLKHGEGTHITINGETYKFYWKEEADAVLNVINKIMEY